VVGLIVGGLWVERRQGGSIDSKAVVINALGRFSASIYSRRGVPLTGRGGSIMTKDKMVVIIIAIIN
jgi:hypothetical protein